MWFDGSASSSHHGRRLHDSGRIRRTPTRRALRGPNRRRSSHSGRTAGADLLWFDLPASSPPQVLPPFQFPGELASLVYLLNPTAGLLDGDGHLVEIDARPGSCAVVTGQSSTRIHPAVRSFATQQWRVKAAADSQLVLLPGPNIPFRGCRYHQKAAIDLDRSARLIWGDIWTPGRYARVGQEAEFHQFERIVQDLEVRRDGALVFRD